MKVYSNGPGHVTKIAAIPIGHSVLCSQTYMNPQTAGHINAKFHAELYDQEERKFIQMMEVTWSRWLSCL